MTFAQVAQRWTGLVARNRRKARATESALTRTGQAMVKPDSVAIEALFQSSLGAGADIVAIVGVERGTGATTVARALARRSTLANRKTVIIDLGGGASRGKVPDSAAPDEGDCEVISIRPTGAEAFVLRSPDLLREEILECAGQDTSIILDCAAAIESEDDDLPGRLSARCADMCFLVCLGGQTRREIIDQAKCQMDASNLQGVVVNGRDQPTVGAEIAREAMRMSWLSRRVAKSLARAALKSRFLDVHA